MELEAVGSDTNESDDIKFQLGPLDKIIFSEDHSLTDEALLDLMNDEEVQSSLKDLTLIDCLHIGKVSLNKILLLKRLNTLKLNQLEGLTEETLNAWEVAGVNESFSNDSSLFAFLYKIDLSDNPNLLCKKIIIFQHMPCLAEINLSQLRNLEEIPAWVARHMQQVKAIDLSDCTNLKDLTQGAIPLLKSLTKLNLTHCIQLSDDGIAQLKNLLRLKELNVSECPNITGSGFEALGAIGLEILCLDNCNRIGSGSTLLKKTTSSIELRQEKCSSISIYLIKIKTLTEISLNHCANLNSKDLLALVRLPKLKKLYLAHCYRLDADILIIVRALPRLELINLCGAPNVSMLNLQETLLSPQNKLPPNLKVLHLDACRQLKPHEVYLLRSHNPDRVITHNTNQGHSSRKKRAYGPSPLATQSYGPAQATTSTP